jgi:hypothetical protein
LDEGLEADYGDDGCAVVVISVVQVVL